MTDREYAALRKMVKSLDDPRGMVFLLLLQACRPVDRKTLLAALKLSAAPWTFDRATRFLERAGVVGKLKCNGEAHYFPIL